MLYELVTGRLPYKGTINEVMHQTKNNAPITPPAALRPDLPTVWNSTIMRCLAHRREDRIQTILEVIHDLAGALESGEATMGFFAPSLVTSIATAPTANTISQSAGGPARTLWSQAHSAIQRKNPPASGRRSWGSVVAGVVIGTVISSVVALVARNESPERGMTAIALDQREATAPKRQGEVASGSTASVTPSAQTIEPPKGTAPEPTTGTTSSTARIAAPVSAPREHAELLSGPSPSPRPAAHIAIPSEVPTAGTTSRDPQAAAVVSAPRETDTKVATGAAPTGSGPAAPKHDDSQPEKPQRPPEKEKRAQQPAAPGTLHVEVQPWADVVIGDWQDTTPVTHPLPAGRHRVLLRKGAKTELVEVVITPNKTTTITRTW